MHSLDQDVLLALQHWIEEGQTAWLCTIVGTFGASPRPVGSLMACNQQGQVTGSLSGGCVEDDLVERLLKEELASFPLTEEYGVSAEQNERLGLPCGGRLTVLVEKILPSALPVLHGINAALTKRTCIRRTVDLNSGEMWLDSTDHFAPLTLNEQRFTQVYGPRYSLLLVGAGQIAECLAQMASMMDYRIIVTDPREQRLQEFRSNMIDKNAPCECVDGMPDDVVRDWASDPFSIVITLTHDPRIDDMALMEALTRDHFYVGALGSARTTAMRKERLQQLDLTAEQIGRLHAPVGITIGSKTAPEIAVSILAELTQLRRAAQTQTQSAQSPMLNE